MPPLIYERQIREVQRPTKRPAGHWLQVVTHLDPKYGGLSATVPQLAMALRDSARITSDLIAFCNPGAHYMAGGYDKRSLSFWPRSRGLWLRDRSLQERLTAYIRESDGVHIHGLWEQSTAVAGSLARSTNKP